ncbi:DUF1295 domain-containing protein [soil metagenome]
MANDLWSKLLITSAASLGAVAVVMGLTCALGLARRKHSIVDVVWGLGFAIVAVVALLVSVAWNEDADDLRRTLVVAMTVAWGVRLGAYIGWRNAGQPDDPRYQALFGGKDPQVAEAVAKVYLPQGLAMWFVSLPVQVAVHHDGSMGVIGWLGVAVWAVGLFFEAVGDAQMARFRADPANKGRVMDRGLWRYTRHPNYFGDSCVWWGIFLVAAERWPGVLTVLSPLVMTYLLVAKTGKALLERSMHGTKPGYADYVARTSGFFPLPPKP